MSKGSKSRIQDQAKFNKGYDKIFTKEPDIPELNVEWACYCEKINLIRAEYNLPSKIFTENDKIRFMEANQ
tara:strand:+ start:388 stop:600 length:213 start_codon:yes stop_codon:yes gene_type:complete